MIRLGGNRAVYGWLLIAPFALSLAVMDFLSGGHLFQSIDDVARPLLAEFKQAGE